NWPHQLYVREARRMKGVHVMTQQSVLGETPVPQSIGMGSYTLDAHNAQRYVKKDGYVQNEGDIGVDIKEPYQVSYGSILPQQQECSNLLVPVCVSASHIAYGSIRMEPVFMILGQSAATAAVLAINGNKAVQEVDYEQLKAQLEKDHQRLSAAPVK
ncbi:FAD-dependent oxidoreductase, partial [Chitinophaga sp.]|uniref:FAD-dependent oxidoreductase n=1 Tax=Chitinophaga sp. TaxID=1869181 RepID=UPI002C653736